MYFILLKCSVFLYFKQWIKNEHNKEFEVINLDPDTEYNGTVYIHLRERSSKSQVFWVKTLPGEAVNSAQLKVYLGYWVHKRGQFLAGAKYHVLTKHSEAMQSFLI